MSLASSKLPLRSLGKTKLEVTVVGFGGIPIQIVPEETAVAAVCRAYELGINFFDTARGYTNSEERIGKALANREVIIATKSGNRQAEAIYRDVKISLASLGRDYIDLYQLHGVNNDDELASVLAPGGALEGLLRARDQGMIGHIGITGHRRETLIKAVETCSEFATVQVPFNLVEVEALEKLIPLCRERNVGVIAMKPIGGGNFANAPLALKWCLRQPISVAIPGMANAREVEENVAIARESSFTEEETAAIEQMKTELDQRTCRRCRYCEPCPRGVQISSLMHGRSVIRRMGVTRWKEWGALDMIASADLCTECGECLKKCPYHLPIPELVRELVAYYRTIPELREDK